MTSCDLSFVVFRLDVKNEEAVLSTDQKNPLCWRVGEYCS